MTRRHAGACRLCGIPTIRMPDKGYVHDCKLADLRVLPGEAANIRQAPPPPGDVLNRDTFMHQARP